MQLPKIPIPQLKKILPSGGRNRDTFAVVDVGSSMVRACIVEVRDMQVVVLGKAHASQEPGAMWGGMIGNLSSVISSMDEAVNRAVEVAGQRPEQLVLGLGGALVGGVTTLARVNRQDPRREVDDKELQIMMQQVANSVLGEAESDASDQMGLPKESLRLVNSALTGISLDGYFLASPLGFSGKEVEIGIFNAFVSDATLVAIQKMLADLNMDLAVLASEPYALAQALIYAAPRPQQVSALIIDVGAGSTSVTLVQQGIVTGSTGFPIGGNSVTAAIASHVSASAEEAETMKLSFAAGKASDSQRHKLQRTVEQDVGVWLKAFKMALMSLEPQGAMPEAVYLAGRGSQLPELQKELDRFGWERAAFAAKPTIHPLEVSQFGQLVDMSHVLESGDVVLASLAMILGHQFQEDARIAELFQKTLKSYSST